MKKWDTVQESLKNIANIYRDIYFLSMMNQVQTTESFRESQHKFLDSVIDKLADKYQDHLEGNRKNINEILDSQYQDRQRSEF